MSPVGNRTKQELNGQTKSCEQDLANYKHRTASLRQSPSSSLSSAIQREETMKYNSNSCDIDDNENSFYEHSCREKIYDQFKRSTSYGGIETNSNFKRFSLKNQDNNFNYSNSIGSAGFNSNSYDRKNHDEDPEIARSGEHDDDNIAVSDIIGSFGLFQAIVLLFSGLREGLVGYDALVMSIILQPDPDKCKWPLVCQNYWMMVVIESAYFLGLVTGNLIWGYCADKFGRRPAYLAAHTMSILFGSLAIFMPSVCLFAVCRFLTAFGSIGYNIIYSIQVELIGLRHRSFSTILNHLGWGLGVICVPLVDHLIDDYRTILSIAPILSLVMFPWAFWLPESSRWLMANGEFEKARHELIRVAKYNGRQITPRIEKSIWVLEQRVRAYKLEQEQQQSGKTNNSYKLIFTNPILVRDTLILAYLAFVGHLFYYVQTLNFAHIKNLSTEANFITSGAGEWVSVIVGAILLKFFSRKTCMSLFLLVMTCSFAFQSLVDSGIIPALDTVLIITTNNGLGTLSSLLLIFIALIVNQEVYPTIVRQTGTSLIGSIGESGSLLAPLLIYISSVIGPEKSNATFTFFCIFGIVAAQFLTKTDDIELPDT